MSAPDHSSKAVNSSDDFENLKLPLFDELETFSETTSSLHQAEVIEPNPESEEEHKLPEKFRSPYQLKRNFQKHFESLTYSRDSYQVFSDWAELAAVWSFTALYDYKRISGVDMFKQDEAYKELVRLGTQVTSRYKEEEVETFGKMAHTVMEGSRLGGADFLGELYNSLEITGNRQRQANGEFFTPYNLGRMMARMSLDETVIRQEVEKKGYISIEEPASGAGCLLIACVERMEELGFDPTKHLFFVARDVSRLCFNMTYIQMSALGVPGIVVHGNTLSLKITEDRPTTKLLYEIKKISGEFTEEFRQHLMLKYAFSELENLIKKIEDKPKKPQGFAPKPSEGKKKQKNPQSKKEQITHTQLDLFDITLEHPPEIVKSE